MGSLIGLEREKNHHQGLLHEFGGIRTMSLITVFGFLVYNLFFSSPLVFAVFTAGYLGLLVASYVVSSYQNKNSGATTEVAGLFAYVIGILVGMGLYLEATVITLLLVMTLYFKAPLHNFAHKLAKEEFYDTIKFIAIAFVVLPLLPNAVYGPLSVLNPYEIWLVVVLVSTISFASYVGIKLAGPKKGIALGGFLGGFISSTAVAMSFSHLSKKSKTIVNPFVFGILIASSAMFVRVFMTISLLNSALLPYLAWPLIAMALTGFSLCLYYWFKPGGQPMKSVTTQDLELKSPFKLTSALEFGLLFAALLFISKFTLSYFGNTGIYMTAFFSGIVDVDAISVSMAKLSSAGTISLSTGAIGVAIATMTNTFSKAMIVLFFGSKQVGIRTALAMGAIIAVGFATILFLLIPSYGFIVL